MSELDEIWSTEALECLCSLPLLPLPPRLRLLRADLEADLVLRSHYLGRGECQWEDYGFGGVEKWCL